MSNYTSFLICFHETHTDIFREGQPLGVIRDGTFEIHRRTLADGTKVPVVIAPEFLAKICDTVNMMQPPDDPFAVKTAKAFGMVRDDDKTPISKEWLFECGFKAVPSDMGSSYADHMENGSLNIWEFNATGKWLFNDADRIAVTTRGELRMLANLLGVELPKPERPIPIL